MDRIAGILKGVWALPLAFAISGNMKLSSPEYNINKSIEAARCFLIEYQLEKINSNSDKLDERTIKDMYRRCFGHGVQYPVESDMMMMVRLRAENRVRERERERARQLESSTKQSEITQSK